MLRLPVVNLIIHESSLGPSSGDEHGERGTELGTERGMGEAGGRWGRGGALFARHSCLVHGNLHWLGPGQGDLELTCGRFKPASVKFPSFGLTAVTENQIENCLLKKKCTNSG